MTKQETLIQKLEKQGWSISGYSPYFTDKDGSNRDRYIRMIGDDGLPRKILESVGMALPCFCDENNLGEPSVSCGDCPRDYVRR